MRNALNLKDSGIEVIVGLYQGSKSIPIAQEYGFRRRASLRAHRPRYGSQPPVFAPPTRASR